MQTRRHDDDPPAFERIRYRARPRNNDRAKPRGKRPWREHRKRSVFAFAV